jgi:hypothetical protein
LEPTARGTARGKGSRWTPLASSYRVPSDEEARMTIDRALALARDTAIVAYVVAWLILTL